MPEEAVISYLEIAATHRKINEHLTDECIVFIRLVDTMNLQTGTSC